MTNSSRLTANQKNALLSTGPRTKAGKAARSANAVQHGILSHHLILPGESRDNVESLLQQLMGEQQPMGTLEQALVERMAVALWRQTRLVAAETAQLRLQQAELTHVDFLRVKQITGVDDMDWINALAREPQPDLVDKQSDLAACDAWMGEAQMYADKDLATLPNHILRLCAKLAEEIEVDTPKQAGEKILGDDAEELHAWVASVRFQSIQLIKVVTALQQLQKLQQSALQLREANVLSRYQSSLDNDLYKAVRVQHESQRHRLHQAALTTKPSGPLDLTHETSENVFLRNEPNATEITACS